ncbi:MAG: family 43 glycosylhydrolase [Tyzzerella sp.]|nr:family 43 glycosylhydrolase [Tyzzerella sp.]
MKKHKKIIATMCCALMAATSLAGCGTKADYTAALNEGEETYTFAETETYKNHIEIEGQWGQTPYTGSGDYGIGDPFVMRFDGKYYMYPSSAIGDGIEAAVKVYESEDLVNWTYKGVAASGAEVAGAYAPEVVYYNGTFYMTESPEGKGHYILASDSPTGPFKPITDNFGRNIDGAFYVGDDGELYFLYAGGNMIQIAPMNEETMLPEVETALPATLNGWTEGPGLFRRGDILYLTYAGNAVTSEGYRVGYSYSMGEDPMGEYILPENNIVLLKAGEGTFGGLGHSSNVIGPNLDSWYTAYHNLIATSGPQRRMMVDQLVTNGAMLLANGPTYSEVTVPERPDFETRGVDAGFVSEDSTEEIYTIEYNATPAATSEMEFMFAYEDEKNYVAVCWSMPDEAVTLITVEDGKETEVQTAEVAGMTHAKLHTIRVEKGADKLEVYVDGMQKIEASADGIGAGKIGVNGDASYSYIAFTNDAYGTSDFESVKNIPSAFPAVHYLKGENRGWSIKNAEVVEGGIRQNEAENTVKNEDDAISALVLDTENDWVKYAVNATEESYYGLSGAVTAESAGAKIQVIVDEKDIYTFTVPESGNTDAEYVKLMLGEFPLTTGNHTLKIRLCSGKLQVQTFEMQPTNPSEIIYENAMDEMNEKGWSYVGNWKITDGAHVTKAGDTAFAYAGDDKMTDFSIEVDVALLEEASMYDGGILLRAKNHSITSSQVAESLQGYYLAIRNDQITLNRYNYGMETLDLVSAELVKGEYHTIKVVMENNHISVYVDDMETPVMDYYDSNAFLSGQIALCSYKAGIAFKNVKIETQTD